MATVFKGETRKKIFVTCNWQYLTLKKYCKELGVRMEFLGKGNGKAFYMLYASSVKIRVVLQNYYRELDNWGGDFGNKIKDDYYRKFKSPKVQRKSGNWLSISLDENEYRRRKEPGHDRDTDRFYREMNWDF